MRTRRHRPSPSWSLFFGFLLALCTSQIATADAVFNRARLDPLFAELQIAPDAETAGTIADRIWSIWLHPDDPLLAGRMSEVLIASSMGDIRGATLLATRLVVDYPSYAEGWNQLATYHFLLNDLDASLADIDHVLALEPRHFGALSGRVLIYLRKGKRALALKDMVAALAVHPFLGEKALFPELQHALTRV